MACTGLLMGETKGEIVNLRRTRKAKARDKAGKEAAVNRVKFGRSRAERVTEVQNRKLEDKHLAGHKRETAPASDPPDTA
ncbi:MAG: DUF4169 family protein [Alphaproteobacteria bacterium]|nr:DUF4169 family protein [Alphaproteobacteria bacterium]